jgi:hypothetical protein
MGIKLKLDKGYSARGADMGRGCERPADLSKPIRLRLEALRWVDDDYDQGGAYWGNSGGTIWCAWDSNDGERRTRVFVRASRREAAKKSVLLLVPGAKFHR